MLGFGNRKSRPFKKLAVIDRTCIYCPEPGHVMVLWPDESEPEVVCGAHGRIVHQGLMEIELLTRLEAS